MRTMSALPGTSTRRPVNGRVGNRASARRPSVRSPAAMSRPTTKSHRQPSTLVTRPPTSGPDTWAIANPAR